MRRGFYKAVCLWQSRRRSTSKTCVSAERLLQGSVPGAAQYASTEPHSCECGELPLTVPHQLLPLEASTEPHSCECGEFDTPTRCACNDDASTEPHSCECGEGCSLMAARSTAICASTEPHSCECGETCSTVSNCRTPAKLQRSRTRVSAERPRRMGGQDGPAPGFNGAALV